MTTARTAGYEQVELLPPDQQPRLAGDMTGDENGPDPTNGSSGGQSAGSSSAGALDEKGGDGAIVTATSHIYVDLISSGPDESSLQQVIERNLSLLKDTGYSEQDLHGLYVTPNSLSDKDKKRQDRQKLRVPLPTLVRSRKSLWLVLDFDRERAQDALLTKVDGSFLVRRSRHPGTFAITVKCPDSKRGNPVFWHGLIEPVESGGFQLNHSNLTGPELDDIVIRCVCSHSMAEAAGIPTPLVLPGDFRPPALQVKQKMGQSRLRALGSSSSLSSVSSGQVTDEECEFVDVDVMAEHDVAPPPARRPTHTFPSGSRPSMMLRVRSVRNHIGRPPQPPPRPSLTGTGPSPVSPRVPPRH